MITAVILTVLRMLYLKSRDIRAVTKELAAITDSRLSQWHVMCMSMEAQHGYVFALCLNVFVSGSKELKSL